MANPDLIEQLKQSVSKWNQFREDNPGQHIDLSEANLYGADLAKANLRKADLRKAHLQGANLNKTDLSEANLSEAHLQGARFVKAKLIKATLDNANLSGARLSMADLSEADLSNACLVLTNFSEAILNGADLSGVNLSAAILCKTKLLNANLNGAQLEKSNLDGADLRGSDLSGTNLSGADLNGVDLREANLSRANLSYTNLSGANISKTNLEGSSLVESNINEAIISDSQIYGINVWDLRGNFKQQKDLMITPYGDRSITVDNIKVAQFIYLLLDNKEIREVIDTLTSKSVLILGRFTPERKTILDELRNKLRDYNLLPILFDFECPHQRDFTETIKTLASISYFVIVDLTNPSSAPLELQAIIPDFSIPFVPIIQNGEEPFSMFNDLQNKYHWVLSPIRYDSIEMLIKNLKLLIIDPAIKKHNELKLNKANIPVILNIKD